MRADPICQGHVPSPDSPPLLKKTYEYSAKSNPLFLAQPEWLKFSTCISAYVLGPMYVIISVCILFGLESIRLPALVFFGFKLNAIALYYVAEVIGELASPDLVGLFAVDGGARWRVDFHSRWSRPLHAGERAAGGPHVEGTPFHRGEAGQEAGVNDGELYRLCRVD